MTSFVLIALLLQAASPPSAAHAPAPPPYKISGLVFGDYYAFPEHHLPAWDGQHGLWLRRVYVTYDHMFSPALSARLRLEMNSNGKLAGGALTPYVKDAYLRWNFQGRQALTLGIQPSLTFDYVESVWGLRHIEKTPLDLYRWDSSRDTGLTLSGPLNGAQTVKYAVQYGNESGNNAETDAHKGFRTSARYEPKQGLTAEVMFGQFNRASDADRTTAQIFAGYRGTRGRAGAQYAYQKRRAAAGDVELDLVSGFGVFDLKPKSLSAFARVDRMNDPCTDCAAIDYLPIAPTHPFTTTIAGVEYWLHPSVRMSPNVEWVVYRDNGALPKPGNDTVARLTFYWSF
ncbi:MAG TPA: hypothetical protein VFZ36_13440 [Vicinamibacterales bacterium]